MSAAIRHRKSEHVPRARLTASVIIPNYNHADVVARAIASVSAQGEDVAEIIVIDDASTDDSVAVIEAALRGHAHARLLRNAVNRGVIETLNRGIWEASGDFVLLAAADDHYLPGMVASCLRALESHPQAGLVCGTPRIEWLDGSELRVVQPFGEVARFVTPEELTARAAQQNILFFTGATLLRRDAILAAGGLMPELQWHADWLLDLVLALRHGFCHLPQDCCVVTFSPHSYSQGRHAWRRQRQVLTALVSALSRSYADVMPRFRRAALLPTYNMAFMRTLLTDRQLRFYLTPLLVWRLVAYRALQFMSQVAPWRLRQRLRGLLRL